MNRASLFITWFGSGRSLRFSKVLREIFLQPFGRSAPAFLLVLDPLLLDGSVQARHLLRAHRLWLVLSLGKPLAEPLKVFLVQRHDGQRLDQSQQEQGLQHLTYVPGDVPTADQMPEAGADLPLIQTQPP
jgi:hypothetical protein